MALRLLVITERLVVDRGGWEVIPEVKNGKNKMEAVARHKKVDDGLLLHTKNFVEVVKSRKMEDLKCPVQAGGACSNSL